jgi:hypothetical protein
MVSRLDPYAWATAAAFFAGLAAGQGLGSLLPQGAGAGAGKAGGGRAERRRGRRLARAIAYLSLSILAIAGLLVLADKASLSAALGAQLLPWAGIVAAFALFAGLFPIAGGPTLAVAALGILAFLRLALQGWLPLSPGPGGSYLIAELLPYEVGVSSFKAHLELPKRDSVPVSQELALGSSAVAVSAESLELGGPLEFLASLAASVPSGAYSGRALLYRVVGLSSPGVVPLSFASPSHAVLLDAFLALPPGEAASREILFGLARRSRATSQSEPLVALQALSFSLDGAGRVTVRRD